MDIRNLNKLVAERKALANEQYKARRELKDLEKVINKKEEELKSHGGSPSESFIKEQNERIDKKCMMILKIQENTAKLLHLDESIKDARKLLEWNSILNCKTLRKHIELVIEDVNELQENYQLDMAVLDKDLREALKTLQMVVKMYVG